MVEGGRVAAKEASEGVHVKKIDGKWLEGRSERAKNQR